MMETRSCKVSDNPGKLEKHVDDVNTSPAQRRISPRTLELTTPRNGYIKRSERIKITAAQRGKSVTQENEPFHCSQCLKSFRDRSLLEQHQRVHTGEKPYHCSQREKSFSYQSSLQAHQRIHTGEKPYECSLCGSGLHNYHLRTHLRIHTGEKPYQYSQCEKSFRYGTNLKRHRHIHTGEAISMLAM